MPKKAIHRIQNKSVKLIQKTTTIKDLFKKTHYLAAFLTPESLGVIGTNRHM